MRPLRIGIQHRNGSTGAEPRCRLTAKSCEVLLQDFCSESVYKPLEAQAANGGDTSVVAAAQLLQPECCFFLLHSPFRGGASMSPSLQVLGSVTIISPEYAHGKLAIDLSWRAPNFAILTSSSRSGSLLHCTAVVCLAPCDDEWSSSPCVVCDYTMQHARAK